MIPVQWGQQKLLSIIIIISLWWQISHNLKKFKLHRGNSLRRANYLNYLNEDEHDWMPLNEWRWKDFKRNQLTNQGSKLPLEIANKHTKTHTHTLTISKASLKIYIDIGIEWTFVWQSVKMIYDVIMAKCYIQRPIRNEWALQTKFNQLKWLHFIIANHHLYACVYVYE